MISTLDIFQLIIFISISFMAAFSISLNNYAKDKTSGKQCFPLLYISECFVSGLSGFFLSMIAMLVSKNFILCMLAAGIGGFVGRRLLFLIVKIAIMMFSASKNIDISKLQEMAKTLDMQTNDDNDNRDAT